MIKPTPGRIVWYYAGEDFTYPQTAGEPLAAIVAKVISDNCVNLTVIDEDGHTRPMPNVPLLQAEDREPASGSYCAWMPYQINADAEKSRKRQDNPQPREATPDRP
jgi:hypothetical protein